MKLLTPTGWKNLNEETGQIDELTTKTLRSYVNKAGISQKSLAKQIKRQRGAVGYPGRTQDFDSGKAYRDYVGNSGRSTGDLDRENKNRKRGAALARGKILSADEEVEQVIDYEAFLEHVVMNYPELVEEFLNKDDE